MSITPFLLGATMIFLDLLLMKIAHMIWPDEPKQTMGRSSGEHSSNWIILDDLEKDGKLNDHDHTENDPFLNGDYDGPDW